MSFNIQHCLNYFTREIDFDLFAQVIQQSGADVIGLNEVNGAGEGIEYQAQAKILAERLEFYYYFAKAIDFHGVDPYGNALLSRYPIVHAETILVPDPVIRKYDGYYETRCLLKALVDCPEPLTVCVTHFGLNPDEQELAQKTVLAHIPMERCVLMGDMNVTPDHPVLAGIRACMDDAAKQFPCELNSFPSDHPQKKIDYIFVSHDLQVLWADILPIVASDHRPHLAVITSNTEREFVAQNVLDKGGKV